MSPFTEDSVPSPYRQITACLAAVGTEAFPRALLALVEQSGARQVMVFALDEGARCLLSWNFAAQSLGEALAESYLDGWHRKDPLRPMLARLSSGERRVLHIDPETRMQAAYRERFFAAPGLSGKTAVLVATPHHRLVVNLYEAGTRIDPDLADLIADLAARHFDSGARPDPLAALSERERAVCEGILQGRKAEAIAGEMGLSAATVVTYRKRAYHKLGIASRGALFALVGEGGQIR